MLRHVVMVNFKDEGGQRERDEFAKKASETLAQVPGTKNIIMGQASGVEGKAQYSAALTPAHRLHMSQFLLLYIFRF